MSFKRTVCVAGKNRVGVQCLRQLDSLGLFDIKVCPVESDIGADGSQPSLLQEARLRKKAIITLDQAYRIPDLTFISLEFDKIIEVERFNKAALLNIHFSLLPAYKGCFTSIWPIYYGESVSGVTLHQIDHGIDTGPIIDQLVISLDNKITALSLYELYQDRAVNLFCNNLKAIYDNDFLAKPQSSANASYYSRKSLSFLSKEIDFSATANQICRQVRALFFPKYQTAMCNQVSISQCVILPSKTRSKPGKILSQTSTEFVFSTIDFDVKLVKYNG